MAVNNALGKPNGLPRSFRMIKSAEFGAVLSSPKQEQVRSFSTYFAVAAIKTPNPGVVRFGLTVGKHNARLSVDRALVKRLLREASRVKRQTIQNSLLDKDYGLDVSLRLKGRLPVCEPDGLSKQARKILLRDDIEKLYFYFLRKLSSL